MTQVNFHCLSKIEDGVHLLSKEHELAIKAARTAGRPLLLSGEPGTGKTSLARAAAEHLGLNLLTYTVDSRSESRDLLWEFDALGRLAEAQIVPKSKEDKEEIRANLEMKNFFIPGPLWWALNWKEAQNCSGSDEPSFSYRTTKDWNYEKGLVVLIDEIDKADSNFPNGLLGVFGTREFSPKGYNKSISPCPDSPPPLVVITTNQERMLPSAFLRRCFFLELAYPSTGDQEEFIKYMKARGEAHFPESIEEFIELDYHIPEGLLDDKEEKKKIPLSIAAAEQLRQDRILAEQNHHSVKPGLAEYLDLLRVICNRAPDESLSPQQLFEELRSFVFDKTSSLANL